MYRLDPFNMSQSHLIWAQIRPVPIIHPIKTVNNSLLLVCMNEVWISFALSQPNSSVMGLLSTVYFPGFITICSVWMLKQYFVFS